MIKKPPIWETAKSRAAELGRIGERLLSELPHDLAEHWPASLMDQQVIVSRMTSKGYTRMNVYACTILLCNVMVQSRCTDEDLVELFESSTAPLPRPREWPPRIYLGKRRGSNVPTYPSKAVPVAETKAGLRFGYVYTDTRRVAPKVCERYDRMSGLTRDFTDDQAACCLILAVALDEAGVRGVDWALRVVRDPVGAKQLSTIIKSLGANHTRLGSLLCEGEALQGRGVKRLNVAEEIGKRTGKTEREYPFPDIKEDELRQAVRKILQRELGGKKVEFKTMEDFWDSRWLWCVNGSHSRNIEEYRPELKLQRRGKAHRRVAVEEWVENPLDNWDGSVYVSASEKMEHGKTRLILACDTVSYIGFEHLLRPVEKAWKNRRVLLDPGRLGHGGMSDRVCGLGHEDSVWLMLDYDDFNSQHSLDAQRVVIEETCKYTGYPPGLAKRLACSFHKMVATNGRDVGRITGTLMSGHRGTTFLNSILNEAYVNIAAGEAVVNVRRLHTGDDIVMAVEGLDQADLVVSLCLARGLRLNPLKQSVGRVGAEFLRMAIRRGTTRGYLCRAIASSVSGNWVNPRPTEGGEDVRTMIANAHTIEVRSGSRRLHGLFLARFTKTTGSKRGVASRLLSREVALEGGPCVSKGRTYKSVHAWVEEAVPEEGDGGRPIHHATRRYLSNCMSDVEQKVLEASGLSPTDRMIDSSYGKTLSEESVNVVRSSVRFGKETHRVACGQELDVNVRQREEDRGLLGKYPVLQLLKSRIPTGTLTDLLRGLGWDGRGSSRVAAWGRVSEGAVIDGVSSYADACHLSRLADAGVVVMSRVVRV